MIYFANFNYPCASMGITINVEACADEDKIKTLILSHSGTSALIKESDVPQYELRAIEDAALYEIDMQMKAKEKEKGQDLVDRLWDIGSSMNQAYDNTHVNWYNSKEWKK